MQLASRRTGQRESENPLEGAIPVKLPAEERVGNSLIANYRGGLAELHKLIEDRPFVILKFTAQWCSPCIQSDRVLKSLARKGDEAFQGALVLIIDVDWRPEERDPRLQYAYHSASNEIGRKYAPHNGKAGLGAVLLARDGARGWKIKPWEEVPLKVSNGEKYGLGENESDMRQMLKNLRERLTGG